MSDEMVKYPRLTDLEKKAKRRIPHFIFEYLDAGTGRDFAKDATEAAYRELHLTPQFLRGRIQPDMTTKLLGRTYGVPFGVACRPVVDNLAGRGADLAKAAKAHGFPYALSTVAGDSIERVSKVGGDMTWFQLYPPNDRDIGFDMLRRAADCGWRPCGDGRCARAEPSREDAPVRRPVGSRGKSMYTPRVIMQSMVRPEWALRCWRTVVRVSEFRALCRPVWQYVGDRIHRIAAEWQP